MWPAFAAVLVCLTAAVLFHVFTRDAPLSRLKQQIRDELPVGSTRAQVEAWAKERLNGQLPAVSGDPPPDGFGRPTWLDLAGVPPEQRGTVLCIDVPCDWYMVRGEIAPNQLFVFFPLNGARRSGGPILSYLGRVGGH